MAKKKASKPKTSKGEVKHVNPPNDNTLENALRLGTMGGVLKRITCVSELLSDESTMVKIAEQASCGASIKSIEMAIGLPPGMLRAWLVNGQTDPVDSEFYLLFRFFQAAQAQARMAAEIGLLTKSPAKWLELADAQLTPVNSDPVQIKIESQGPMFKDFDVPHTKTDT